MTIKIERGFNPMTDRYEFDFRKCSYATGWAQLDTRQDASYYGNWVNPIERKLVNYCEGDVTIVACDTDEEFVEQVRWHCQWHDERGYGPARIDAGNILKQPFEALGLGDLLH